MLELIESLQTLHLEQMRTKDMSSEFDVLVAELAEYVRSLLLLSSLFALH
jgi:hypothetical protein